MLRKYLFVSGFGNYLPLHVTRNEDTIQENKKIHLIWILIIKAEAEKLYE